MNRRGFLTATIASALASRPAWPTTMSTLNPPGPPVAPRTPKIPVSIEQLGRSRTDDYAWLKDPEWRQVWRDPSTLASDIRTHLEDENAYSAAVLAPTQELQRRLYGQMRLRSGGNATPPPLADDPWLYYQRFPAGAEQAVYLRRPRHGRGAERVLLDAGARARGHTYFAIPHAAHSPDHRLFAWAEDDTGAEKFKVYVRDLGSGEIFPQVIEDGFGTFTFSPDSEWLYWIWRDPNSRPRKLFRRPARGGADQLIYEETDPGYFMTVARARSNAYLFIRLYNGHTSEVRVISATDTTATPRTVEPRTPEHDYDVEHWHERFVIRTNADGAVDFKLMWADEASPCRTHWREFVPHRPGRCIEELLAFREQLVRLERVDANPVIVVTDRKTLAERTISFDEPAYTVGMDSGSAFDQSMLRVVYESPRYPRRWYDCELSGDERFLIKTAAVPGGLDPQRYVVERLYARAADGETVPITIVRQRRSRLDGAAPLLLYGYGSYGFSTEAEFSIPVLSLVDMGWIYAIAHVRGGGEKGRSWYLQGLRASKKRSFTDFISCAEHLIERRYTSARRIVIYGLSAGGLLVGAVANLRPDLWGGVIAQAAFVDMLNTMSDAQHPLVPLARPDWGDPLADPAAYDWIAAISPYENIRRVSHPPILATGSVPDDRVGYWEPAKWVAKLRDYSTSGQPVLFRVAMRGGHMGATGRFEGLRQQALFWAFADWALKQRPSPA
jgi:oligopeptidase B